MTTNFPTSVDSFPDPTATDRLDNPPHDVLHADVNDAVEAIETALLDGAPLYIDDANERVGIGTTTPAQELDVNGSIATTGGTTNNRGILLAHQSNINYSYVGRSEGGVVDTGNRLGWDYDTDNFDIKTGGDTRLTIDSSGNVGIGTETPSTPLDIYRSTSTTGTADGTTFVELQNYVGSDLSQQKTFIDFTFTDDNSNETPQVRIGAEVGQNGDANTQQKEGSGAFVVYTNNAESTSGDAGASLAERMRIDSSGNVGIGTTTPSQTLDVRSANDNTSVFQHTTNGSDARIELRAPDAGGTGRAGQVFFDPDANFVGFRNGNINAMGVDSSGNVGIGDTTPSYKLDVNGTGRFTSDLYVNGTLVTDVIQNDNGNSIGIEGGDGWNLGSNMSGEYVWIASEGGLIIVSSDNNSTNWANREQIRITAEGGIDNRLRVHGRIRTSVTGEYGSVETGGVTTWDGYSIDGRVVFMHDGGSAWGIYNDVNNEWMLYGQLNGGIELRHNNILKANVVAGGLEVYGELVATGYVQSNSQLRSAGVYNTTTAATADLVHISGSSYYNRMYRSTSRRDAKKDIESITDENALALLQSRPVWFRSAIEHDDPNLSYYGFIAEELAEVDPRLCTWGSGRVLLEGEELNEGERACTCENNESFVHTFDHEPDCIQVSGVDYGRLTAHLTKIAQIQQTTIDDLTSRIQLLETA